MSHRNHIDPAAGAAAEIRRISGHRISSALKWLRKMRKQPEQAVHEVRKELKRLRAMVRLLRESLGKRQYRKLQRDLRRAGRVLSPFRDAEVRLRLVEELLGRSTNPAARQALQQALGHMQVSHRAVVKEEEMEDACEEAASLLRSARRHIRSWVHDDDALADSLHDGLRRSYDQARLAMRRTVIHPMAENFHDWRKACKTLRHQLDVLLLPPVDGGNDPRIGTLHELSGHLGNLNDLEVLEAALEPLADTSLDTDSLSAIRAELEERMLCLVRESWAIGREIFALGTSDFFPSK